MPPGRHHQMTAQGHHASGLETTGGPGRGEEEGGAAPERTRSSPRAPSTCHKTAYASASPSGKDMLAPPGLMRMRLFVSSCLPARRSIGRHPTLPPGGRVVMPEAGSSHDAPDRSRNGRLIPTHGLEDVSKHCAYRYRSLFTPPAVSLQIRQPGRGSHECHATEEKPTSPAPRDRAQAAIREEGEREGRNLRRPSDLSPSFLPMFIHSFGLAATAVSGKSEPFPPDRHRRTG